VHTQVKSILLVIDIVFNICLLGSGLSLIVLLSLTIFGQALTPSTYITPADRERFRRIFLASAADDLESLYYSVVGISLLEDVPSEPQARPASFIH